MHANPHATSAAIGGAIGGLDQDEDGNIVFNPQGFALGLLGGAGGSKAVGRVFQHKSARAYALKSIESLQDSYKALSKNNPALFAKILGKIEPRSFLKSKKKVHNLSKEVFNKELSKAIEAAIKGDNIVTMPQAQFKSINEFASLFDSVDKNKGAIQTPYGNVRVNIKYAWEHFSKNTYNTDRENIKGGFFETFRDPLFIVEQIREGANKPSAYFYKPFYDYVCV